MYYILSMVGSFCNFVCNFAQYGVVRVFANSDF